MARSGESGGSTEVNRFELSLGPRDLKSLETTDPDKERHFIAVFFLPRNSLIFLEFICCVYPNMVIQTSIFVRTRLNGFRSILLCFYARSRSILFGFVLFLVLQHRKCYSCRAQARTSLWITGKKNR